MTNCTHEGLGFGFQEQCPAIEVHERFGALENQHPATTRTGLQQKDMAASQLETGGVRGTQHPNLRAAPRALGSKVSK